MQIDNQSALQILQDNLTIRFKNKEYSIDGLAMMEDSLGQRYLSYGIQLNMDHELDVITGGQLDRIFGKLCEEIESIVSGLVWAKKHEKPEGECIARRHVVVHWRQYPELEYKEEQDTIYIRFRISIHHKP